MIDAEFSAIMGSPGDADTTPPGPLGEPGVALRGLVEEPVGLGVRLSEKEEPNLRRHARSLDP